MGVATGLAKRRELASAVFELSAALSFYHNRYYSGEISDSFSMLCVPVRFGWFVWKGLEIEPEISMFFPLRSDGGSVRHYFEAKVVYNFKASGKLIPFLGGTTGWGNGLPKRAWNYGGGKVRTMADGLVAGLKIRIGPAAALRAEYKLVLYSWREAGGLYREGGTLHHGSIGLSIFF